MKARMHCLIYRYELKWISLIISKTYKNKILNIWICIFNLYTSWELSNTYILKEHMSIRLLWNRFLTFNLYHHYSGIRGDITGPPIGRSLMAYSLSQPETPDVDSGFNVLLSMQSWLYQCVLHPTVADRVHNNMSTGPVSRAAIG